MVPAVALLYLVAHLLFLSPALEDIDSINFALGLHDYNVAAHQPHPPGYPAYIALGRGVRRLVAVMAPDLERVRADALALALLSAVGGALALIAAAVAFRRLAALSSRASGDRADAGAATSISIVGMGLLGAAPLFWMTGLRPMSDMPGLALAIAAQALLLGALGSESDASRSIDGKARRAFVIGALVAGISVGVRSQTMWLTLPLLAWAAWRQRSAGLLWLVTRPVATGAVGVMAWAIPLLVLTGGPDGYLRALGSQAGEDFAWVDMLWSNPTPRRLAYVLYETFVVPWASVPLVAVVGVAALTGAAVMLARERRGLGILFLAFGPYTVFHMLFQETVTARYALPVVPAVVFLAARGIAALGALTPIAAVPILAFSLVVAVPAGVAYGREVHPAFRAIDAMIRRAAGDRPAAVYAHFAVRRPLQAGTAASLPIVEPRRGIEWLGPVEYWRGGGRGQVWFVADPRRTDLALIDPRSLGDVDRYRWSVADRPELAGTRPLGVDWYRIPPPGWFAGEGWSLTAETGGVARASAKGLDRQPIKAYLRRRAEPMNLMVGGRDIGPANGLPAIVDVTLDGRELASWRFDPSAEGPNFLRFIELPGGVPPGEGDYAPLVISARAERPGVPTPLLTIRQFDAQPSRGLIAAFGDGWHEDEYENATGLHWRWTSERSVLRIVPAQGVVLTIRGESPRKYFDAAPTVRVTAAGQTVAELRPESDFEWRVTIPASAVAAAKGDIAIETDRVYRPGQAERTADVRRLGLRLFDVRVDPVFP